MKAPQPDLLKNRAEVEPTEAASYHATPSTYVRFVRSFACCGPAPLRSQRQHFLILVPVRARAGGAAHPAKPEVSRWHAEVSVPWKPAPHTDGICSESARPARAMREC